MLTLKFKGTRKMNPSFVIICVNRLAILISFELHCVHFGIKHKILQFVIQISNQEKSIKYALKKMKKT